MMDFDALRDFIYAANAFDSHIHGLEHWMQVERNGMLLASATGADVTVVRLFSIFHDSRRWSDGFDWEHGPRGAEFAKQCRDEKRFELDDERFEKLYYACAHHTKEPRHDDATIDTCYDADRLDLGRVYVFPDPHKMATEAGSRIAEEMMRARVDFSRQREWILRFHF